MLSVAIFLFILLAVGASSPPVIDISSLYVSYTDPSFSYEKILRTASLIDHVLQKYGVFVAVGHNLTSDLLEANQKAMHELFQLPKQDKESVSLKTTAAFGRGYLGFGEESGLLTEYFEPKEGFSYGFPNNAQEPPPNLLQSRNFWPAGLSFESRTTLEEVYKQKVTVAKLLLFALSKYFNVRSSFPEKYLEDLTNNGHEISLMRLFHYYNVQDDIVQNKVREFESSITGDSSGRRLQIIGSSPHTDWGLLTLILQDNVGGLEFLHEGEWVGVTPTAGGIVVNGGDYLRMVTNYRYHSPIHRVLSPNNSLASSSNRNCQTSQSGSSDVNQQQVCDVESEETEKLGSLRERYSMVFFYYPNYEASLVSGSQDNTYKFHDHTTSATDTERGGGVSEDTSKTRTAAGGLNYNTLEFTGAVKDSTRFDETASTAAAVGSEVMFGDYIIKKWKGVSRN